MTLEKERSEQTQWYTYLDQERQGLSTSVESTLAEPEEQKDEWDEEHEIEATHTDVSKDTSLIPPRLSLQSKVMLAVQAAKQATKPAKHAESVVSPADAGEEQQKVATKADTNVFMRLVRRLASSFMALGAIMQPEAGMLPAEPPLVRSISQSGLSRPETEMPQAQRLLPAPAASVTPVEVERKTAVVEDVSSAPSSAPAPPAPASGTRRRLAGTAKVRLETTPLQAMRAQPAEAREQAMTEEPQEQAAGQQVGLKVAQSLPHTSRAVDWQSPHVPDAGIDVLEEDRIKTSMQLPIVSRLPDVIKPISPQFWFGNGAIECGECEKMIADEHATTACIVNVTLTDNPGPVVVHYVSRHPGIGFTVHLTAPANAKTSFTYVILSSAPPLNA